jgi:transcriptional regulator GlxA family with amidase domain
VLDGLQATTNKRAFAWASSQSDKVRWKKEARWVEDGKFFTSSGVSAGMDMALALIARLLGRENAEQIAVWTEYEWHSDAAWDPFAKIHGLVEE